MARLRWLSGMCSRGAGAAVGMALSPPKGVLVSPGGGGGIGSRWRLGRFRR